MSLEGYSLNAGMEVAGDTIGVCCIASMLGSMIVAFDFACGSRGGKGHLALSTGTMTRHVSELTGRRKPADLHVGLVEVATGVRV